jgi:hypothetical protein
VDSEGGSCFFIFRYPCEPAAGSTVAQRVETAGEPVQRPHSPRSLQLVSARLPNPVFLRFSLVPVHERGRASAVAVSALEILVQSLPRLACRGRRCVEILCQVLPEASYQMRTVPQQRQQLHCTIRPERLSPGLLAPA